MKASLVLAISVGLIAASSSVFGVDLEGCPSPVALAAGLTILRESDWRQVSASQVLRVWPTRLVGSQCDTKSCSSMISQGRIIRGAHECTESFDFDVSRNPDGTETEHLNGLTIHYTSRRRADVLFAVRLLAVAIGLPEGEAGGAGREGSQHFQWETSRFRKELSALELELTRMGDKWTLYFGFRRGAIPWSQTPDIKWPIARATKPQ